MKKVLTYAISFLVLGIFLTGCDFNTRTNDNETIEKQEEIKLNECINGCTYSFKINLNGSTHIIKVNYVLKKYVDENGTFVEAIAQFSYDNKNLNGKKNVGLGYMSADEITKLTVEQLNSKFQIDQQYFKIIQGTGDNKEYFAYYGDVRTVYDGASSIDITAYVYNDSGTLISEVKGEGGITSFICSDITCNYTYEYDNQIKSFAKILSDGIQYFSFIRKSPDKLDAIEYKMTITDNKASYQKLNEYKNAAEDEGSGLDEFNNFTQGVISKLPTIEVKNGNVVYFNPVTNERCSEIEYKLTNSNTGVKTGCMKWYIYKSEESQVGLILDHNTTAKVKLKNGDTIKTIKKQLEEDTKNWKASKIDLIDVNDAAKIAGYTGSLINGYCFGRDFSRPQVSDNGNCGSYPSVQSKYGWLFDRTSTFCKNTIGCYNNADVSTEGYWTKTVLNSTIYFMEGDDAGINISSTNLEYDSYYGIRPVIMIEKAVLN